MGTARSEFLAQLQGQQFAGSQPLRGRPAEGRKPLSGIVGPAARIQREFGGPTVPGTGLPDPSSDSFPAQSFRRLLLDAGIIPGFQPTGRLAPQGSRFRGGSSTAGGLSPVGNIGQARGVFGLGAADRRALNAVGAVPGLGLPSLVPRAVNRIFGPTFGVVGSETIAPRIGTGAFGRTVRGGSFGSNRGPGARGSGFGGFGGPR